MGKRAEPETFFIVHVEGLSKEAHDEAGTPLLEEERKYLINAHDEADARKRIKPILAGDGSKGETGEGGKIVKVEPADPLEDAGRE